MSEDDEKGESPSYAPAMTKEQIKAILEDEGRLEATVGHERPAGELR